MANNKIDRINKEIAKTREKITEYQNKLKGLEAQKTEAENLEIVQLVRAMRLTPQELNAMTLTPRVSVLVFCSFKTVLFSMSYVVKFQMKHRKIFMHVFYK